MIHIATIALSPPYPKADTPVYVLLSTCFSIQPISPNHTVMRGTLEICYLIICQHNDFYHKKCYLEREFRHSSNNGSCDSLTMSACCYVDLK